MPISLTMRCSELPDGEISTRLPPWQKRTLYGVSGLLWVSGACWLYTSYFGQGAGGDEGPNFAGPLLLKIHGAAAMAFLLAFGTLLPDHLPNGWQQEPQRPSGCSLVAVCVILIVTGWGLYYFGHERLREATSAIHSVLGILLPMAMGLHVSRARRNRSRMDVVGTREDDSSDTAKASAVASSAWR